MMFQSIFTSSLLVVLLQLGASIAPANCLHLYSQSRDVQPLLPSRRSVYNPMITNPLETTKWKVGSQATVTWDLSNIPQEYRSQTSKIVLGYINSGSSDEHLDLDHPLAQGFKIADGQVRFTVPNVTAKDNYIVVRKLLHFTVSWQY
ncbi:hypothetical protein C0991_012271 [Blastosporella zonata]|nr:hypothetical protein C0991_012271 [Blastosporella zonata]